MSDVLVLVSFISFVLFLTLRKQRKYAAAAGWSCMVLNLITDVPAFLSEDNILYPAMALLSLPFLAVTVQRLLKDDPVILQLSRTAAVATLIYVPFSLVPILRDALISTVVGQVFLRNCWHGISYTRTGLPTRSSPGARGLPRGRSCSGLPWVWRSSPCGRCWQQSFSWCRQ
jgi:archaeosortase A (PGF-CTERM-specific)